MFEKLKVNCLDDAWVRIGAHKAERRGSSWTQLNISMSGVVAAYLGLERNDSVWVYRGRESHKGWIQVCKAIPNADGEIEGVICRQDSKGSALRFRITGRWLGVSEPHATVKALDVVPMTLDDHPSEHPAIGIELPEVFVKESILDPWEPGGISCKS